MARLLSLTVQAGGGGGGGGLRIWNFQGYQTNSM